MHFKMSSAIYFNLDQSESLSYGNELKSNGQLALEYIHQMLWNEKSDSPSRKQHNFSLANYWFGQSDIM